MGTVDVGGDSIDIGDYTYVHGPAIRFVAELDPSGPKARNALPGGEIFDPASPHYRDMLELWRKNQTFDFAFKESDVAASAKLELGKHGDGRVHFQPK
jgi:penicillin amidase